MYLITPDQLKTETTLSTADISAALDPGEQLAGCVIRTATFAGITFQGTFVYRITYTDMYTAMHNNGEPDYAVCYVKVTADPVTGNFVRQAAF